MFFHSPIMHDRQCVGSEVPHSTVSLVYVDLPDATITTKSIAEFGSYIITFSALMNASLNNTIANFRVSIGGVPVDIDGTNVRLKVKELDISYPITCVAPNVPEGAIIKVEYKTDKGAIMVEEYNLTVDGVPESRIVE